MLLDILCCKWSQQNTAVGESVKVILDFLNFSSCFKEEITGKETDIFTVPEEVSGDALNGLMLAVEVKILP